MLATVTADSWNVPPTIPGIRDSFALYGTWSLANQNVKRKSLQPFAVRLDSNSVSSGRYAMEKLKIYIYIYIKDICIRETSRGVNVPKEIVISFNE